MGWSQTLTSDEACAGLRDFFFYCMCYRFKESSLLTIRKRRS